MTSRNENESKSLLWLLAVSTMFALALAKANHRIYKLEKRMADLEQEVAIRVLCPYPPK